MSNPYARLTFLAETAELELMHLRQTAQRLFVVPFDVERAKNLRHNLDDSERTDAFVGRFGRLQDTVGDKLLPEYLRCLAEPVGAAVDNLDRAERLGLLKSTELWLRARKLRNRMVHEYVRDPAELADALNEGNALLPILAEFSNAIVRDCKRRNFLS